MRQNAPAILLATIISLALLAGGLIASDHFLGATSPAGAGEFQRLTGGLGLGPAAAPGRCQFSFDPRTFPDWRTAHHPVICGEYFCPRHAGSVFYLSPLDRLQEGAEPFDAGVR